ncbi:MAG: hypothetical protein J7494_03005 [Sphingobium sp.]|nr:hypothetical protein [Sphingobium sp.]
MAGKAMQLMRDPHATRVIEQLQQTGSRLAAATLPTLARTARETGRTVAEFAQSTSKGIADRLAERQPSRLERFGRASGMFSVARFAARRPVLVALGGVAVVGVAIALGRRMREARMEREGQSGGSERSEDLQGIGEGSYEGTRDYRRRTQRFLKDKGDQVAQRASEAKSAVEGAEHSDLERAEQEGLSHARA